MLPLSLGASGTTIVSPSKATEWTVCGRLRPATFLRSRDAFARHPDDNELVPRDEAFLKELDDGPGFAAFHHHPRLPLLS